MAGTSSTSRTQTGDRTRSDVSGSGSSSIDRNHFGRDPRSGGSSSERDDRKALLIVDVSNLYYCVRKQYGDSQRLDYELLIDRLTQEVRITRAIAYGADMNHAASGFKAVLHRLGFETKYKQPKVYPSATLGKETRKADWDVGMAMDVVRLAKDYDIVIFGTADGDLAPCVDYIREQYPDKECWVMACGISRELKAACHQWREIQREDVA